MEAVQVWPDTKKGSESCPTTRRGSPFMRPIIARPTHFPALWRVAQAHDLPSESVLVMYAHRVVRSAPRNKIGRQHGKHDALAVDDLLPLGKCWARQLGQRRELGGRHDSSFRRASHSAFRCRSASFFGMRSRATFPP